MATIIFTLSNGVIIRADGGSIKTSEELVEEAFKCLAKNFLIDQAKIGGYTDTLEATLEADIKDLSRNKDNYRSILSDATSEVHRFIKEPYLVCEGNSFLFSGVRELDFNQALGIAKQCITIREKDIVSMHEEIATSAEEPKPVTEPIYDPNKASYADRA